MAIYCGTKAFELLHKHLNILYPCTEIKHRNMTFVLNERQRPDSLITDANSSDLEQRILDALIKHFEHKDETCTFSLSNF